MKLGTLLLIGGAGFIAYEALKAHPAPASPAKPGQPPGPVVTPPVPGPPKIDPGSAGWTVIDWSKITDPSVKSSPMGQMVPANGFVTSAGIGDLVKVSPDLGGAVAGTLAAWIVANRNGGHKVYMSAPITDQSGAAGYILMLDSAPAGFAEVSA